MKFYIASSLQNKDLVKYVGHQLVAKGYRLTYDWTKNDRATTDEHLHQIGMLEKQGVADSEVFLLLLPAGKGSHVELGIALALGKKVYIYSPEKIDLATASTFYFVDGVERFHGMIDEFITRLCS